MPTDRSQTWDGGYIRVDAKGRRVYYIRRRIEGRLYDVSTRATSSEAAQEHWRRFQANPAAYVAGDVVGDLTLNGELVRGFLTWSRDEKKNTPDWVGKQRTALEWWAGQLGLVDLRHVSARALAERLDGVASRKQKIATIKTFCAWLIHVRHRLEANADPTAGLLVPQTRPEQWTVPKTFTRAQFRKIRAKLAQPWRDCADVLASSGWHSTELARFIHGAGEKRGAVEAHPTAGGFVLVCPQTKGGEPLRTHVASRAIADAAKRLLASGVYDYFSFRDALRAAARAAGLKASTAQPGTFRHSVATEAINRGASPEAVAAFLNHRSAQTTKRFYATHAVAAKVPTLI